MRLTVTPDEATLLTNAVGTDGLSLADAHASGEDERHNPARSCLGRSPATIRPGLSALGGSQGPIWAHNPARSCEPAVERDDRDGLCRPRRGCATPHKAVRHALDPRSGPDGTVRR